MKLSYRPLHHLAIGVAVLLAAAPAASASPWLPLDLDKAPNGKPIAGGVEPGIAFSPKANRAGSTVTVANVSFVLGSNLLDVAGSAPKKPAEPGKPEFRWMGVAGVDYPLTLTKVIVAMPPHILYGNGERPVEDTAIWIDRLSY